MNLFVTLKVIKILASSTQKALMLIYLNPTRVTIAIELEEQFLLQIF